MRVISDPPGHHLFQIREQLLLDFKVLDHRLDHHVRLFQIGFGEHVRGEFQIGQRRIDKTLLSLKIDC